MSKVPKGAIGAIGAIGAERCHRCPSFHGKTLLVLHKKLELHSFFIVSRQIDKTREKTIHLYDTPMTPIIIATVSPVGSWVPVSSCEFLWVLEFLSSCLSSCGFLGSCGFV